MPPLQSESIQNEQKIDEHSVVNIHRLLGLLYPTKYSVVILVIKMLFKRQKHTEVNITIVSIRDCDGKG